MLKIGDKVRLTPEFCERNSLDKFHEYTVIGFDASGVAIKPVRGGVDFWAGYKFVERVE